MFHGRSVINSVLFRKNTEQVLTTVKLSKSLISTIMIQNLRFTWNWALCVVKATPIDQSDP